MPSITSLGLGSGLDAESIIAKLMQIERQPLNKLQQQEATLQTQLSSFGRIKGLFSDLQTAATSLSSLTLWNQTIATSADTSSVTASTGTNAAAGAYAVNVTALATGQTATSGAFASSATAVSTGTLTLELGTYGSGTPASSFTAKTGTTPVTVTIDAAHATLAGVRDQINAANAGVTATIVTDASGARLSIRSSTTGAENAFRVTASAGLGAFGYDATLASNAMTRSEIAQNASATINGIAVNSSSNTLTNVVDGLTLNLLKTTSSPVNVTVAADKEAVKKTIDDFVKSFNALASLLHEQTKYDSASKTAGPLQGNRAAVSLQGRLRAVLNNPTTASTAFTTLSAIGISIKTDGTLETNATKLDNALNNLPELKKALSADTGVDGSSGFMVRYRNLANTVLGADGTVTTASDGLSARIKGFDKRQEAINTRLAATEARLRAQYQALDRQMSTLNGLSTYVSNQMAALTAKK